MPQVPEGLLIVVIAVPLSLPVSWCLQKAFDTAQRCSYVRRFRAEGPDDVQVLRRSLQRAGERLKEATQRVANNSGNRGSESTGSSGAPSTLQLGTSRETAPVRMSFCGVAAKRSRHRAANL